MKKNHSVDTGMLYFKLKVTQNSIKKHATINNFGKFIC